MNKPQIRGRIEGMNAEMAGTAVATQAAPLAWYTVRTKDGKQTLEFGSCLPSNHAYIKAHPEWDWIPLYAAPVPADLTEEQISKLLQIGDMWMSQDGRDALSDWIHATRSQA